MAFGGDQERRRLRLGFSGEVLKRSASCSSRPASRRRSFYSRSASLRAGLRRKEEFVS